MNSEYISLKSSGKLNLISNSKLRSKLVNFYEVYYSIYKELEEEHKFFIDKRVNDYFFNQFPSDTSNFVDSEFVKSKLNDQTFKKILDQQITSLQYITENFYIEKIDELIKRITEELKNKIMKFFNTILACLSNQRKITCFNYYSFSFIHRH